VVRREGCGRGEGSRAIKKGNTEENVGGISKIISIKKISL